MSKWIDVKKKLPPEGEEIEVKFRGIYALQNRIWICNRHGTENHYPVLSKDQWRPVKPPKSQKPETRYSAAVCLPREGMVVEVEGGKGKCRYSNGNWFHLPYSTPWWRVEDTDEWRPVEGEE